MGTWTSILRKCIWRWLIMVCLFYSNPIPIICQTRWDAFYTCKRQKIVSLPGLRDVFVTAVIMTESSLSVKKADFSFSKLIDFVWLKVLDYAIAKYCKALDILFRNLKTFMKVMDGNSFLRNLTFVLTDPSKTHADWETGWTQTLTRSRSWTWLI